MWDEECEDKARALMRGFVGDKGKPPLEEQQAVVNWLNQMLPYPGWRFKLVASGDYWAYLVASDNTVAAIGGGMPGDSKYTNNVSADETDTLMEMMTALELNPNWRYEAAATLMERLTRLELNP